MFLRHKIRRKDGKEHRYWSVVENRRVCGGRTVQRHVLDLGEINDSQRAAWCQTIEAFDEGGQSGKQIALFPEVVQRRCWTVMGCMSGSVVCACAAHANGAGAGWHAIYGISFNWMSSARHVCQYRARGHAG